MTSTFQPYESNCASYGDGCAEFYDEIYSAVNRKMIHVLNALARGGRVLELGIGTGRAAIPLMMKGIEIEGIESSKAMIEQLRAKPGSKNITVHSGNFAKIKIEKSYSLIFCLVNTFFLLGSHEEQQECLKNIASHLTKDGLFLIENFVITENNSAERETIQFVEQQITTLRGIKSYRVRLCSVSLETLDNMAKNAGLRLRERFGSWECEPFVKNSSTQISIYERDSLI